MFGSIAKDNEFIIYGSGNGYLFFSSKSRYYQANLLINEVINNLSCKFIVDEIYVCAMLISDKKLILDCFKYHINPQQSDLDTLTKYKNIDFLEYYSISSFGLYDTDKNDIKILCKQSAQTINCNFLKITINIQSRFSLLVGDNIVFTLSNDFTENNCYLSQYNDEYLFCCGIIDYLKCYRISINYNIIKEFKISISGIYSHLTIKYNNDYVVLFL